MTYNSYYKFDDIGFALRGEKGLDRMVVNIDPNEPYFGIWIQGWEYDGSSENDPIVNIKTGFTDLATDIDSWAAFDKEHILTDLQDAAKTAVKIRMKALIGFQ